MRKLSMMLVSLMLLLPSLASAWTLTVNATGASATNTISIQKVSDSTELKSITGPGTFYVYPTVPVKAVFTPAAVSSSTVAISGGTAAAYVSGTSVTPNASPAAQTATLNIKFNAAATYTITPVQATGGTVYIQGQNPITSLLTSPLTVLGSNTVKVAAYPLGTQRVTALIANGSTLATCSGTAGQACSANLTGAALQHNQNVTATYANAYTTTASLQAPTSALSGSTVTLDARSSSTNDTAITTYAFTISGSPAQTVVVPGKITFVAPATGPVTASVQVTTTNGSTATSATASISISSSADVSLNFCANCHNGRNPGLVDGFTGSRHWTSTTNGPPDVFSHGTNCSQSCHFKSANAPSCQTCHSQGLQADGSFVAISSAHSYRMPTAYNSCMVCHEGGRHGVTTDNWNKSSHAIANNHFEDVTCVSCHNPHSTVATATDGKTDSCASCVDAPRCGVMMTLSIVSNGESFGGSVS